MHTVPEKLKLYSNKSYIDITKSKSLTSPIVVPPIFVMQLNGKWCTIFKCYFSDTITSFNKYINPYQLI